MSKDGLLKVHEPPLSRKDALDATGNPKEWLAHEICAKIVPETWVDEIETNGVKERMIFGVDAIVKDRWNLVSTWFNCSFFFFCFFFFLSLGTNHDSCGIQFFRNVPRVRKIDRKATVPQSSAPKASAQEPSTSVVRGTAATRELFSLLFGKWRRRLFFMMQHP